MLFRLGFPNQLSGRLYGVTVKNDGTSETIDVRFQIDRNKERLRADSPVNGQQYSIFAYFQEQKFYVVYPGGCFSNSGGGGEDIPSLDEIEAALNQMTVATSGKLGLKGASVNLYSLNFEGASSFMTLESGNQCIPVSYASKDAESVSTGSFLDLTTSANPEKWKIPEECQGASTVRSLPVMLHTAHVTQVMRRGFPWIKRFSQRRELKRGFPWIN